MASAAREVSPMMQRFRQFLLGRNATNALRFRAALAERPGPEANLPEGPSHKVAANYYFTRDGRREVTHPNVLADNTKFAPKVLTAGEEGAEAAVAETKPAPSGPKKRTPGQYFNYSN